MNPAIVPLEDLLTETCSNDFCCRLLLASIEYSLVPLPGHSAKRTSMDSEQSPETTERSLIELQRLSDGFLRQSFVHASLLFVSFFGIVIGTIRLPAALRSIVEMFRTGTFPLRQFFLDLLGSGSVIVFCLAVFIVSASFLRDLLVRVSLERKFPDSPWRWNHVWRNGCTSLNDANFDFGDLLLLNALWFVAGPLCVLTGYFEVVSWFIAMIAVLIWILLMAVCIRDLLKPRMSVCLASVPLDRGEVIRGQLTFPRSLLREDKVDVELRCDYRATLMCGIDTLWMTSRTLQCESTSGMEPDVVLTFDFSPPLRSISSSPYPAGEFGVGVFWKLTVTRFGSEDGAVARFSLPVFFCDPGASPSNSQSREPL